MMQIYWHSQASYSIKLDRGASMTDRRIVTLLIVVLCILLTLPFMSAAQGQEKGQRGEKGGGGGGRGAARPPVNLQILPEDLTRQQVVQVMEGFNMALGVRC